MALSDYMPYGAPELLDSAQARMARSTLTASCAVALLTAVLGAWTARSIPPAPGREEDPRVYDMFEWIGPPPPTVAQPEVPPAPPARRLDESGEVRPVREEIELPRADAFERAAPNVDGLSPPSDAGHSGAVTGNGTFAVDPRPDEFVWTDEMPVLVRQTTPRYPDLARDAGVEGTVIVQVLVGLDGRVEQAIIAPRGSVLLLDEAALEAARTFVFTPALANNRPVKVWVRLPFRFALR